MIGACAERPADPRHRAEDDDCIAPVNLLDLEPHHCRWPVNGGGPFLFCANAVTSPMSPYCAHHAALAVGCGTRSERAALRTLKSQVDHESPIVPVE